MSNMTLRQKHTQCLEETQFTDNQSSFILSGKPQQPSVGEAEKRDLGSIVI